MDLSDELTFPTSSLKRRCSGRNNSFKSSPIMKTGLKLVRSRKSSTTGSADSSPVLPYKPVTDPRDLRRLPSSPHELAFMVALEASKDVKDSWDAVVKEYCESSSKKSEVCGRSRNLSNCYTLTVHKCGFRSHELLYFVGRFLCFKSLSYITCFGFTPI